MKRIIPALFAPILIPQMSLAQPVEDPFALDRVIVSGGLTPVDAQAYGRASSVITAEEIEDRGIVYAVEALRSLPGVSVSRTGSFGGLTLVRLRGAESNHTLVLIDGIDVSAPESGEYDFGGLLAADIERIEVLRGPQSALYGSNALGGVISIITKGASGLGRSVGGAVEAGSDESYAGSAYFRYRDEDASVSVSGAHRRTGGFDVSGDPGGEDDGDVNTTANLKAEVYVTDWLTVGGSVRAVNRESDFDDFNFGAADRAGLVTDSDNVTERAELFGSVFVRAETFNGRVEQLARAQYSHADAMTTNSGVSTQDTEATRTALRYQATAAIDAPTLDAADHRLTLAGEFERETFANEDPAIVFLPSQLETQRRDQYGLAAEYRGTFFDALDLQLGLRHDFNDKFDDATTWSAGASYRFAPTGTRPHASIGTGVQNPTLFEQFGFANNFQPNPDLEPEKSFGWDVGVEQTLLDGRAIVDVTYFRQDLEDEIGADFTVFPFTPVNQTGESERQGIEVSAEIFPTDWADLRVSYTWLDAENPDGTVEVRRPEHEAGVAATVRFLENRASLTLDGRYLTGNVDSDFTAPAFGGSQIDLDDYVLVNLAGSYRVTEQIDIFGGVRNLFDEEYQEVDGFETEGITGFLGLRARW